MKWDIFGKKKIEELSRDFFSMKASISHINDTFVKIQSDTATIRELKIEIAALRNDLIDLIRRIDKVVEIPLVKPRIRDPETIRKREEKEEIENYNLYKN